MNFTAVMRHPFVWLLLALLVASIDIYTKYLVEQSFYIGEKLEVFSWFNVTLTYNTGVAFSMFVDLPAWFFSILVSVICVMLVVWMTRLQANEKLLGFALAFILGGALGNLYDRITIEKVVDFIDWHGSFVSLFMNTNHWPTFNLADCAVLFGVFILFIDSFRKKQVSWDSIQNHHKQQNNQQGKDNVSS